MEIKTSGPFPKLVAIGSFAKPKASTMTKEDLMRIKLKLNLSGKQTLHLRTGIRTVFDRKSVEDGAGDYQAELNHSLEKYFKSVTLNVKKRSKVKKVIVVTWEDRVASVCHNIEGLISHLMELREINPDEEEVMFGLDDGGGSLKLMMLILKLQDHDEPKKKGENILMESLLILSRMLEYRNSFCSLMFPTARNTMRMSSRYWRRSTSLEWTSVCVRTSR